MLAVQHGADFYGCSAAANHQHFPFDENATTFVKVSLITMLCENAVHYSYVVQPRAKLAEVTKQFCVLYIFQSFSYCLVIKTSSLGLSGGVFW